MRVSGTVRDQQAGEAIPGVSIVEKGTENGTVTDVNGQYSMAVSGGSATLIFTFVGYECRKWPSMAAVSWIF